MALRNTVHTAHNLELGPTPSIKFHNTGRFVIYLGLSQFNSSAFDTKAESQPHLLSHTYTQMSVELLNLSTQKQIALRQSGKSVLKADEARARGN